MISKTHWKSRNESHRKVKQTKNWAGKRESQWRWNAQIGDRMGLWWLKSATIEFLLAYQRWNANRRWLAWVIDDGKLKSATVGFLLAHRWRNAHRRWLLGLLVTKCSSTIVGFLGYWLQVMMKMAWKCCLVFRLLGVKWNERWKGSKRIFIVKALATQYFCC